VRSKTKFTIDDLPPMACEKCGACCCVSVPLSDLEAQRITDYVFANNLKPNPKAPETWCPWFYPVIGCTIYEVRPWACRMFGHVKEFVCDKGNNVNIDRTEKRQLLHRYQDEIKNGATEMRAIFPKVPPQARSKEESCPETPSE
jgi:Fe-S-cluster containining protein